ncbi:MAG: proline--tRNA ligase [Candidatus Omnitrophota bacterium]|nr:proline--tRNA ligase [Candidatus Omnitrophota bacterium]
MRWSHYFLPTLREEPKDAEAVSHKLMLRAGLIRRLGAGAYSYLPLGLRALQRAIAILREEMRRAGAQEILLPTLHPLELWKTTGRDAVLGQVLIRFKDRTGKELVLGPTHEEVVTDLVKEIRSHKQLPLTVYQIQTKFRDEPRPRFGVIRSKEFLMKDAYSFDVDPAGLERSYQAMYEAYRRVFDRCGLTVIPCEADPGAMGGDVSHEFMAPSDYGEDRIVRCTRCAYAANREAARCEPTVHRPPSTAERSRTVEEVETPGKHTVEEVSRFLNVPATKLIKTLLYDVGNDHVAVLVRGDHEVNEAKLARVVGSASLRLSSASTIERLTGAPMGFVGPLGLRGIRLLADHAVMGVVNGVTGANRADSHCLNVNAGRDFQPEVVADLRVVTPEDACPSCRSPLTFLNAIEVGHVFRLGTKYSQAMGALVQDAAGAVKPMVMGCYGIGVNRIIAAAIEQHHDADGIVWPVELAPFQVVISVLESEQADHARLGAELHEALGAAGVEVLWDDRQQSPGSKLKDADLIGIPVQVVIGKVWQREQLLEVGLRSTKERLTVPPTALVETVRKLLDNAPSL